MARKAKHDQRPYASSFVCEQCQVGNCELCMDVMRIALDLGPALCNCKRKGHDGEATDKQITDPETGTVWGPGLRVTQEGEIIYGGHESSGGDHG